MIKRVYASYVCTLREFYLFLIHFNLVIGGHLRFARNFASLSLVVMSNYEFWVMGFSF